MLERFGTGGDVKLDYACGNTPSESARNQSLGKINNNVYTYRRQIMLWEFSRPQQQI